MKIIKELIEIKRKQMKEEIKQTLLLEEMLNKLEEIEKCLKTKKKKR